MPHRSNHFTTRRFLAALLSSVLVLTALVLAPSAAEAQSPLRCGGSIVNVDMTLGQRLNPQQRNVVWGTSGRDVIHGGAYADIICGNGGHDQIYGGGGNDVILGGAGNDLIYGQYGNDRFFAGAGNDRVYAGPGNDLAFGGNGYDVLDGGTGSDRLFGDDGNDILYGRGGSDLLEGSDGDDRIYASSGDDRVYAGSGNDEVNAGSGNDTVEGGPGNDRLYGLQGRDTIWGETGEDVIYGGSEDDTLYGDQNTVGQSGGGNDVVHGGPGNDVLYGGYGNDELLGASGNDQLWGSYGNDVLSAGGGNDSLFGGAGNDRLDGSAGTDNIDPGSGNDTCDGYEYPSKYRTDVCTEPTFLPTVTCASTAAAEFSVRNNGTHDSLYEFSWSNTGVSGGTIRVDPEKVTIRPGDTHVFRVEANNDSTTTISMLLRRNGSVFRTSEITPCSDDFEAIGVCAGLGGGIGVASIEAQGCIWRDRHGQSWASGRIGGAGGLAQVRAGAGVTASLAWFHRPMERLPSQNLCTEAFVYFVGGATCWESLGDVDLTPNLELASLGVGIKGNVDALTNSLDNVESRLGRSFDVVNQVWRVTDGTTAEVIRQAVCKAHGGTSEASGRDWYPSMCDALTMQRPDNR